MTTENDPKWLDNMYESLKKTGSSLEVTTNLFKAACELTGMIKNDS
jgi:hypothetical protein